MIRVLGRETSINVRKVLWTADEIGIAVQHEPEWATPSAPASSPEFMQFNPNGLVPVLEDEHGILWESNTICRYLAARHGRGDLLPSEPHLRARVEMWMDWQATELNGAWRYAFMALVRNDPAYADRQAIEASLMNWNAKMRLLDDRLASTQAYVAGADFTIADIVIGLSVHRYYETPFEHPVLPAVERYVARLSERPGYRRFAPAGTP